MSISGNTQKSLIGATSAFLFLLLTSVSTIAQVPASGGPIDLSNSDDNRGEIDELHKIVVARSNSLGPRTNIISLGTKPELQWPLRLRPHSKAFSGHWIGYYVDHDGTTKLKDWACSARTYDGHAGTDLQLGP